MSEEKSIFDGLTGEDVLTSMGAWAEHGTDKAAILCALDKEGESIEVNLFGDAWPLRCLIIYILVGTALQDKHPMRTLKRMYAAAQDIIRAAGKPEVKETKEGD